MLNKPPAPTRPTMLTANYISEARAIELLEQEQSYIRIQGKYYKLDTVVFHAKLGYGRLSKIVQNKCVVLFDNTYAQVSCATQNLMPVTGVWLWFYKFFKY